MKWREIVLVLLSACSRDRMEVRPDPGPPRATIEVPVSVPLPPPKPEPPPPPPQPTPPPPGFDNVAARAALAAIKFKHCALDRPARVLIRFHPAGNATIDRIATEDPLPSDVDTCLIRAFETARVPLFEGAPVSIAFLVR